MNYSRVIFVIIIAFSLLILPISAQAQMHSSHQEQWGFQKRGKNKPPRFGRYKDILDKYNALYLGDPNKKEIYLTFDNGYENGYTVDVLDVLKKKNVPAAFFVTGHYMEQNEDLIKRMVNEGHIIGNHTWHHPDLTKVGKTRYRKELNAIEDKYKELTGRTDLKYLRPPRGTFSELSLHTGNELGYTTVMWSLAFVDWHTKNQKGWRYAYNSIMKQIHPGAIILLHIVSEDNAKALEKVIDDLEKEGYKFRTLDHLLIDNMKIEPLLFH